MRWWTDWRKSVKRGTPDAARFAFAFLIKEKRAHPWLVIIGVHGRHTGYNYWETAWQDMVDMCGTQES